MIVKFNGKEKQEILGLVLEPGQEFEVLNNEFIERIRNVPSMEIIDGSKKAVKKPKAPVKDDCPGCPKTKKEE